MTTSGGAHGARYELKRARSQAQRRALAIGAVAERAQPRPSAIRYYEQRGLLPAAERVAGRRVYDESILDRLAAISLAKRAGFTLAETRLLLAGGRARRLARKAGELDARIAELTARKQSLARLAACGCKSLLACGRIADATLRAR